MAPAVIAKQGRPAVEIVHSDVHVSVVVVVGEGRPPAGPTFRQGAAQSRGHVLELAVAQVSKHQFGLGKRDINRILVHLRVHVSVGHKQVFPTVVVVIEEGGPPSQQAPAGESDSCCVTDVAEDTAPEVAVQRVVVVGEVGDVEVEEAVVVIVAQCHAHPRLSLAVFIVSGAGQHADLPERSIPLVLKQKVCHRIVGDIQVQVAVVIEIAPDRAQAIGRRHRHSRGTSHIREGAVTVVVIEHVRCREQALGSAMHPDAPVLAIGRRRVLVVEGNVVDNVEVQPAVAVIVREGGAGAPPGVSNPRGLRDVGERAIAVVAIQCVAAVIADVKVRPAIVVVVAGSNTHAPAISRNTRRLGDVSERAITVISIEGVRHGPFALHQVLPSSGVHKVKIRPAVLVVVDPGHTAAEGLRQIFLFRTSADVLKPESRLRCDIHESDFFVLPLRGRRRAKRSRAAALKSHPKRQCQKEKTKGVSVAHNDLRPRIIAQGTHVIPLMVHLHQNDK